MTRYRQGGRPSRPPISGRGTHVLRPIVVALVIYAMGLIPFYYLTPVRATVENLYASKPGAPTAVVVARSPTTVVASPTPVDPKDVSVKVPIVAPEQTPEPAG